MSICFYFCQYLSPFHSLLSVFIRFSHSSVNIYPLFMHFCQYLSVFHILLLKFIGFSLTSVNIYQLFMHFCQYLSTFHALRSIFIRFSCTSFNIYSLFMHLCQYLSYFHATAKPVPWYVFQIPRLRESINKSAFACSWPWLSLTTYYQSLLKSKPSDILWLFESLRPGIAPSVKSFITDSTTLGSHPNGEINYLFSTPVQSGSEVNYTSCTMGTAAFFTAVRRSERAVDRPPQSTAEV